MYLILLVYVVRVVVVDENIVWLFEMYNYIYCCVIDVGYFKYL